MIARIRLAAAAMLLAACGAPASGPAPDAATEARLAELYRAQDCFGLRDALAGYGARRGGALDFYRAAADVAFSRPAAAIPELRRFLRSRPAAADPRRRQTAYELLADAYVRAGRYREAAQVYDRLAGDATTDSAGRGNASNVRGLWAALAGTPAQTVRVPGPVRIDAARDRAGLVNVPVAAGGATVGFVWDTGANLSTVTESTAREMGFRVLDATVDVGSSTGALTRARVGVAPELRIGDATVRNAVFLVFPDSALAFPQIDYQIRGIVGFPVIAAFGATTVMRSGGLVLADTAAGGGGGPQNLCMRGLMPIVAAEHEGRRLHFTFDTGAQTTSLYPPFHALHRAAVERRPATTVRTGGAGGTREVRAFSYSPLVLALGGREVTVPTVSVFAERTTDDSEHVYGNLGQDVIRQFESMTFDFRRMQIRFN